MYHDLHEDRLHGTKDFPYVFYHLVDAPKAFLIPVHWHHELEIIYIRRGPVYVSIAGEQYVGNQGMIFVVNSGELHFMTSEDGNVDYFTFLFPLEMVSFVSDDFLENNYFMPLRSGKMRLNTLFCNEAIPQGIEICEKLVSIPFTEKENQLGIRILLLELFNLMISNGMLNKVSSRNANVDKEMITYIQQNFCNEITLSELAENFHLSEKYISRYFKEHFQLPLTQYIKHLRLSKAKQLLISTEQPITEIAFSCGFYNVSHFIRTFKSTYSVSPLQYRKQQN